MEGRSFVIATIIVIVGSVLIAHTNGSPVLKEREERSNLVESSAAVFKPLKETLSGKLQRQGRYYMGYPYGGGLGYGGATASASASASASSGGMGMGYGGYPYMYGR